MNKPFWEETYEDYSISTFGIKPNKAVAAFYKMFDKSGSILEVGCGEGKNSIFLAENGFDDVDAFDLSHAGIEKLLYIASAKNIKVNAWVDDLTKYTFTKFYDAVISYGTLHFVKKNEWIEFIQNAKKHTNTGGFNIFQIFTNKVPASKDIAPYIKGLADEGELDLLYKDWKILESSSYVFEDVHPGVEKHLHASNTIVAQKRR